MDKTLVHSTVECCSNSQFKDEHHVCAVLVHIVQRYDVGVLELLQDAHFPHDLLSTHTSPAGMIQALLDEFSCIHIACALLCAVLDNSKLPTVDTKDTLRHFNSMKCNESNNSFIT